MRSEPQDTPKFAVRIEGIKSQFADGADCIYDLATGHFTITVQGHRSWPDHVFTLRTTREGEVTGFAVDAPGSRPVTVRGLRDYPLTALIATSRRVVGVFYARLIAGDFEPRLGVSADMAELMGLDAVVAKNPDLPDLVNHLADYADLAADPQTSRRATSVMADELGLTSKTIQNWKNRGVALGLFAKGERGGGHLTALGHIALNRFGDKEELD